jgi:hypothetical protein
MAPFDAYCGQPLPTMRGYDPNLSRLLAYALRRQGATR